MDAATAGSLMSSADSTASSAGAASHPLPSSPRLFFARRRRPLSSDSLDDELSELDVDQDRAR